MYKARAVFPQGQSDITVTWTVRNQNEMYVLASNVAMKRSNKLYVKKRQEAEHSYKKNLNTVWHEIFAGSNFFAIFPNTFPQYANKNYRKHFPPSKIYPRVNIL